MLYDTGCALENWHKPIHIRQQVYRKHLNKCPQSTRAINLNLNLINHQRATHSYVRTTDLRSHS